jgi:hypothetical protein
MYRVIAIVGAGLALAACSSSSNFFDSLKPAPSVETVRFESEPPGAEAKTSAGQTCRTPCALALPSEGSYTVTFSLNGYQPDTEQLAPTAVGDGTTQLRPNPVVVELTPAPPPPKPTHKKPVHKKPAAKKPGAAAPAAKKPVAKKPAAKPTAAAPAAPPPPAPAAIPPAPAATSPWPASPPPPPQQ